MLCVSDSIQGPNALQCCLEFALPSTFCHSLPLHEPKVQIHFGTHMRPSIQAERVEIRRSQKDLGSTNLRVWRWHYPSTTPPIARSATARLVEPASLPDPKGH